MRNSSSQILDLRLLLEATGRNTDFIRELLQDYVSDMNQQLLALNEALQASDSTQILQIAHTISGTSATIGAKRMHQAAARIETRVKRGQLEGLPSLVELLEREWDRLTIFIMRYYQASAEKDLSQIS